VNKQSFPFVFGKSIDNLLLLSRRCFASLERRFLEEFEKALPVLARIVFHFSEYFLCFSGILHMLVTTHLHGSVSRVERLADFLVRFPIFLLTDL
jgi:hypothetical protein